MGASKGAPSPYLVSLHTLVSGIGPVDASSVLLLTAISPLISLGFGAFAFPAARGLRRTWVTLYTLPLPARKRRRRREKVDQDISNRADVEWRMGYRPGEIGLHILGDMLLNMPHDLVEAATSLLRRVTVPVLLLTAAIIGEISGQRTATLLLVSGWLLTVVVTAATLPLCIWLVLIWVRLYTSFMPSDTGRQRRAEIHRHLWNLIAHKMQSNQTAWRIGVHVLVHCCNAIPRDLKLIPRSWSRR